MNWQSHYERWILCKRCELEEKRKKVVLGMGRIQHGERPGAPFFCVGQYPGEDEDRIGLPMQGKGGRWVHWAVVDIAGIPWDEAFITNVLGCKPQGNPKAKSLEACAPRIHELLTMVQPRIIVAMGLLATKFFASDNKVKMGAMAGKTGKFGKYPVFFTTHPFEPPRQKTAYSRQESERNVIRDYEGLRDYCTEMGLLERIME